MPTLTQQRIGGPPGGLNQVKVELTQAEIQSLKTSPPEAIAAPGAGKQIEVLSASAYIDYNGTPYTGSSTVELRYSSATATILDTGNLILASAADVGVRMNYSASMPSKENEGIVIYSATDPAGAGGTLTINILYRIIDTY